MTITDALALPANYEICALHHAGMTPDAGVYVKGEELRYRRFPQDHGWLFKPTRQDLARRDWYLKSRNRG